MTDQALQNRPGNVELAPPPPAPTPQYMEGFEGAGLAAFPEAARAVLSRPPNPDDVEIKPDGIVYLPGVFYRAVLTEAFGAGGWAILPRGPARRGPAGQGGESVMYHGALVALGRYVAEAVGSCTYWPANAGMTYADAFEGARTDCITKCCKDLGVARELWDPGWRGQWQAKYAQKVMKRGAKGDKEVWERKGREQKLDRIGPRPAATSSPPPVPGEMIELPATAQGRPPVQDNGEAVSDDDLEQLDKLVFEELKWKKQYAATWLQSRFGFKDPASLTQVQLRTASYLLLAFNDKERYQACLAEYQANGRCK